MAYKDKICQRCGQTCPATGGGQKYCPPCSSEVRRETWREHQARKPIKERNAAQRSWWAQLDTDAKRLRARDYALMTRYGITQRDYEALYEAQNGLCYVCGRAPGRYPLVIDHDHALQGRAAVRGLLCGTRQRTNCNIGISMFHENPEFLRRAAEYLESPPAHRVLKNRHGEE